MPRILIITGLWIPLIGKAPTEGQALAERLAKQYPRANVSWHSWFGRIDFEPLRSATPLILIGHSFGGGVCVKLASDLASVGKNVDELLLLDPVPTDFKGRWQRSRIDVPANVRTTRCIARSMRLYPRSKKASGQNVTNETTRVGHDQFMSDPSIVETIESIVERYA